MPRGDGTGPAGGGDRGGGKGKGNAGKAQGGRAQTVKSCVCPNCGKKVAHQPGQPCNQIQCPDCKVALAPER
ncbi:MAG: hypothetical protein CVV42_18270 [Candidatus Riflebacteria bacterium HGW-Riflebacteria-2]|nr:MAG: hypothetical protein CVV42_18270 [Candidatus Riflebacteria bacterium HGW-Riflebacteria-2]